MQKFKIVPVEGVDESDALSEFHSEFVKISEAQKNPEVLKNVRGKLFSEIDGSIKKILGDKFDSTKSTKELMSDLIEHFESEKTEAISEVEEKLKAVDPAKIKDVEEKYTKKIDMLKQQLQAKEEKLREVETGTLELQDKLTKTERNAIIKEILSNAENEISLVNDPLILKAYKFDKKDYTFDIDEEGKEIVKKGDNIVMSKTQAGNPATYSEILKQIAEDNKAIKIIDGGNKNEGSKKEPLPGRILRGQ